MCFFWKTLEATSSVGDLSKPDQHAKPSILEKPEEPESKAVARLQVEASQNGFDVGEKTPNLNFSQLQESYIRQPICLKIPSFIFTQLMALKAAPFKQRDFLSFMKR